MISWSLKDGGEPKWVDQFRWFDVHLFFEVAVGRKLLGAIDWDADLSDAHSVVAHQPAAKHLALIVGRAAFWPVVERVVSNDRGARRFV